MVVIKLHITSYKVLLDWHEAQESAHLEVPEQDTVIAFDNH